MKNFIKNITARPENGKRSEQGFSLVELIIVIAIMAILVGLVGTQVIPYLSRSRAAKDQQILNTFSTAAVLAYSSDADYIDETSPVTIYVYEGTSADAESTEGLLSTDIVGYISYDTIDELIDALESKISTQVADVKVEYDFENNQVRVVFVDSSKAELTGVEEVISVL